MIQTVQKSFHTAEIVSSMSSDTDPVVVPEPCAAEMQVNNTVDVSMETLVKSVQNTSVANSSTSVNTCIGSSTPCLLIGLLFAISRRL